MRRGKLGGFNGVFDDSEITRLLNQDGMTIVMTARRTAVEAALGPLLVPNDQTQRRRFKDKMGWVSMLSRELGYQEDLALRNTAHMTGWVKGHYETQRWCSSTL